MHELKELFVKSSYESLERLEGKTGEGPFFRVRSDRITVCTAHLAPLKRVINVRKVVMQTPIRPGTL